MKLSSVLFFLVGGCISGLTAQDSLKTVSNPPKKTPKNVILMIGDGTGLAQWYAAQSTQKDNLQVFQMAQAIGFSKTSSSSSFITDSGAGATAISIGEKTFNKAIGVKKDSTSAFTLSEILHVEGYSTGVIATCGLTHATPASFYAHQPSRYMEREIAQDFYGGFIDVAAGGDYTLFDTARLKKAGYSCYNYQKIKGSDIKDNRYVLFYDTVKEVKKFADGRGPFLRNATMKAIESLSSNQKGFFLMVEGSQIDWGGHDNDLNYVITETLDFDTTIGMVANWAKINGETLVIVTADHETGGLSLTGYDKVNKHTEGSFSTKEHTAIAVPVFAFGPGSEEFIGVYENNEIHNKILKVLKAQGLQ